MNENYRHQQPCPVTPRVVEASGPALAFARWGSARSCLWRRSLACVGLWLALSAPLQAQEFRAAWADIFHSGMGSQTEVSNMVATLVSGHYNAVVVQVLGYMDRNGTASHGAHWQSDLVPWSTRVKANFDPLAYLCTEAHNNGIEVHAWIGGSAGAMYRVSNSWPPANNTILSNNPQWFIAPLANSEGGAPVIIDGIYALDMGSPDAQEYIVSIVKELVTNYPIDGINWDDELNGAGYNAGFGYPAYSQAAYPRSGLARFRINNGYPSTYTPSNTDPAWSDYRRRFKNELMARVQAEIQSIKTNPRQPLRHTSAALAYSPVPSSCDFTKSTPYLYFCDWPGMLQHGWVDAVIPQTYSSSTFNTWADRIAACWQYERQVFPGIGAYLNTDATIASEINYTRSKGLKGNCIYSYAVPNSAGNSDWWAYAAANVYTNVVSTPPMPWRDPATATNGMMWGRVQDFNGNYVDDATVTIAGGQSVKTDGNGYYVATLIPADPGGTAYSVTASKPGLPSHTISATVLPGDVVRYDFLLIERNPPALTSQPQSVTVFPGQRVLFSAAATGTLPLSYQWWFNGAALPGRTTNTLTIPAASIADAGAYSITVTNPYGQAASTNALLVVMPATGWGDNSFGQSSTPQLVTNAIAIVAGAWHTLALRVDGGVVAWGDNSFGQCDVPDWLQDALAIAAGGYHGLAIRANETVTAWGSNDYGQTDVPPDLGEVIGIAAGTWHSVALRVNGTVAVWGDNSFGQTDQPAGLTNVTAVAAGGNHSLALKTNGTVAAWGENTDAEGRVAGQSVVPSGLTNVVAIAAGDYHSLAIRADGRVVAWGANSQGQLSLPPSLTNVVAIAAGGAHSVALRADGSLVSWGANWNSQCQIPSGLGPAAGVAAGAYHSAVLLTGVLPAPRLLNPARTGSRFTALVQTLNRKAYALDYKDALAATNWTSVCTNAGNGALKRLADPAAAGTQRFYRMRQW